jgi:acyl dehydratase
MLYALGLGLGERPTDPDHLKFVYEENLEAFPTLPVIFGLSGVPMTDLPEMASIDYTKLVHSEENLILDHALPAEGDIICRTKVADIVDKGVDKGAILYLHREIYDGSEKIHYATIEESQFLRGNGGFAGESTVKSGSSPPDSLPDRAPDQTCDIQTLPQMALLYRLSGDLNPLHVDPKRATTVGFEHPILHGLCSFGIAARAILQTYADMNPARLLSLQTRFTAPVYPGETIKFELWLVDEKSVSFRAGVEQRDAFVLNNGKATIGL